MNGHPEFYGGGGRGHGGGFGGGGYRGGGGGHGGGWGGHRGGGGYVGGRGWGGYNGGWRGRQLWGGIGNGYPYYDVPFYGPPVYYQNSYVDTSPACISVPLGAMCPINKPVKLRNSSISNDICCRADS